MRLQGEEARGCPDQCQRKDVICGGLKEAGPGQSTVDENVRPERGRSGLKAYSAGFGSPKQSAEILEKISEPGFGRNQEMQRQGR